MAQKKIILSVLNKILEDNVVTDRELRMLKAFELGFSKDEVIKLIRQQAESMKLGTAETEKAIKKYLDNTAEFRK